MGQQLLIVYRSVFCSKKNPRHIVKLAYEDCKYNVLGYSADTFNYRVEDKY